MVKCGKGCMPECEYFTTGGCISPFNCPYKIETGYINSATSIPTYMEQYNGMSDDDIERCIERLSTCKATDVMNFDYSGTLAYIKRLKAENAELREKLSHSIELPCPFGTKVYAVFNFWDGARMIEGEFIEISTCPVNGDVVVVAVIRCEKEKWDDEEDAYYDLAWRLDEFNKSWWADKEAAHAELEREQKLSPSKLGKE